MVRNTNGTIEHIKIVTSMCDVLLHQNSGDYIIAVDAGIKVIRNQGIVPDLLVGDFDSANAEDMMWAKKCGVETKQYPAEKNETDTELAIKIAVTLKPKKITLYNNFSSRFDHAYSLLINLYQILLQEIDCKISSKDNDVYLANKKITLNKPSSNCYVSIFPFITDAQATATGLKYQLPTTIKINQLIGISNEFIKDSATIEVTKGIIMVMLCKE